MSRPEQAQRFTETTPATADISKNLEFRAFVPPLGEFAPPLTVSASSQNVR
jgi:hypothetical protein